MLSPVNNPYTSLVTNSSGIEIKQLMVPVVRSAQSYLESFPAYSPQTSDSVLLLGCFMRYCMKINLKDSYQICYK